MIQAFAKRLKNEVAPVLQSDEFNDPSKRVQSLKNLLKTETDFIQSAHNEGADGLTVTKMRSMLMDMVITRLVEPALEKIGVDKEEKKNAVAVIALGGYGREELCPLSDIDLMFLYPNETNKKELTAAQEVLVQEVLYPLWDSGLKVGHSTRTIDEAFKEARADVQNKTAMLEARLISGSQTLFDTFQTSYHLFYRKENPNDYIQQRLQDQRDRRAKNGGSVFMQEPDIKAGVGGLRDYHNTLWMARVRLNLKTVADLARLNYLRKEELNDFTSAYEFLLRVRNELHFRSKRPTDLLTLELQPKVALRLGYKQRDILKRVEAFMRDYYQHAKTIYQIATNVERRLSLSSTSSKANAFDSVKKFLLARRKERVKRIDGFLIRGQEISAESDNVFQEDPVRLIRVFRHKQQNKVELDFELSALIKASVSLIDDTVRNSKDANTSFRSLMHERGNVYPALSEMHEHGVLAEFVPEWGRLTCLVQHEYFHRYTADVHTLHTIRELDEIFSNPDRRYHRYRDAVHQLDKPTLLYFILFLHDVGKSKGIRDHANSGVEVAEPVLERLNIDEESRVLIRFIIKNHLQMARFWQRYDIDDPDSAKAFADQVESPERLRLLYVHTFCDARGTAAGLWNQYKDTLHSTLYSRTLEAFKSSDALEQQYRELKKMTQSELLKVEIEGIGPEEINAHFKLLPDRYFINTSKDEIILHIRMINQLLQEIATADSVGALKPVIDWKEDINRSMTVVNVITWDRAGLFHKLAGALNLAGYNILSAKAISRDDHIAIDTFYVTESSRSNANSTAAQKIFADAVKDALMSNKDLYPRLLDIMKKEASDLFKSKGNPLAETFAPQVDVYHELSLQRTILEVQAPDHLGLLYQIANSIYKHGFDITFARINTERGIAIDTLYLSNVDPKAETDGQKLMELRDSLCETLAEDPQKV